MKKDTSKVNFVPVFTVEEPVVVKRGTIYIVGEDAFKWVAILKCPCGCGDTIYLNLIKEANPRWRALSHPDASISIVPSVRRTVGCRSHFVIRRGILRWAFF